MPGAANGSDFVSSLLSTSYVREAPGTGEMRHGTEGWHSLETSLKVGLYPPAILFIPLHDVACVVWLDDCGSAKSTPVYR